MEALVSFQKCHPWLPLRGARPLGLYGAHHWVSAFPEQPDSNERVGGKGALNPLPVPFFSGVGL